MNKIFLFFINSFLILSSANAQEYKIVTDNSEFISKLEKKSNEVKNISASFQETIYSSLLLEPGKNEGQFLFEKPEKIRWEKFNPSEVIIFDGNEIKRYRNKILLNNLGTQRITKKITELILVLVNGSFHKSNDFDVSYYENSLTYKLDLKPTKGSMAKAIKSIELNFSKVDLSLNEFTITESEFDYINYKFTELKYNKPINSTKFKIL